MYELCGFVTRSIGIDSLWKRNNGWGRSGENLVLLLLLLIPTVGHQAKSLLQRRQTKFNLSGASTIRFDFDEELHAARNSSKTERSVERSVHDKLRPEGGHKSECTCDPDCLHDVEDAKVACGKARLVQSRK